MNKRTNKQNLFISLGLAKSVHAVDMHGFDSLHACLSHGTYFGSKITPKSHINLSQINFFEDQVGGGKGKEGKTKPESLTLSL